MGTGKWQKWGVLTANLRGLWMLQSRSLKYTLCPCWCCCREEQQGAW